MKNRWDAEQLKALPEADEVDLRVYSSNLLGQEEDLVLHGGGNTSVKGELSDVFGQQQQVLYVKGSGWDLKTIERPGFPPVRLAHLLQLGELPSLSDSDMMRQLRLGLLDPGAPTPSVEAILHALIPFRFVDHSHADAVVTISNTPDGERRLKDIYGDEVLILPYIMPGFILARQVAEATRELDWQSIKGIILMHHGIFTFDDDAKRSYDNMIELVSRAEQALARDAGDCLRQADYSPTREDALALSRLRRQAGQLFAGPVLLRLDHSPAAAGFASLENCAELIGRGPLTPDHSIHAKAFGAVFETDPLPGLEDFAKRYQAYFETNRQSQHQCLDLMPRYGVWRDKGLVYLAANSKRLGIVQDISRHTIKAIQQGEALERWQALPEAELFEVEYWELEQAKLKGSGQRPELEGKVALVSGAASGIGRATVQAMLDAGAVVLALDIDPELPQLFDASRVLSRCCDITDGKAVAAAIQEAVLHFGGLDILVSNAGNFPPSAAISELDEDLWQQSMDLNLSAHMRLLKLCSPYLEQGFDPAVVFIASKNVPAPGPGAAAYSVAKAGLTQLMRVAALELGEAGVRVNALHPNAVYDTRLWDDQVLASRAEHYGLSVAEYKANNVLRTEVRSADVAAAVLALSGPAFRCTTGAQLPVDGGNERVI